MIGRLLRTLAGWTPGWTRPPGVSTPITEPGVIRVDARPAASTPSGRGWGVCAYCGVYNRVADGPDRLRVCVGCCRRLHEPAHRDTVTAAVGLAAARLAAVQQAVGAVDAKAALAATIQGAALAGLLATPAVPGGWLGRVSLVALLAALALSGMVVTPRLTRRPAADARDAVWFGQLRAWDDPGVLAAHLHHLTRQPGQHLEGLARQLTVTSRIVWRKHLLLRGSLAATGVAVLLHTAAVLTSQGGAP